MRLVINISEYDKEWIQNTYGIPQEINVDIAKAIINGEPHKPNRKKGKWILGDYEDMYYICDQCGHKETEYYSVPKANFCKVCGADMRGGQDEIDRC